MKIDWVLCDFYEPNTTQIVNKILQNTKKTSIISYGNLLCKNKKDLEAIYKILINEYKNLEKGKKEIPNLIIESINQMIL